MFCSFSNCPSFLTHLVCSGCCNQIPQMRGQKAGRGLNNRNLFLTVLEAASPRSGSGSVSISNEAFLACGQQPSCGLASECTQRDRAPVSLLIRTLILWTRTPPLGPHLNYLRPHLQMLSQRVRALTQGFGGDPNIQSITLSLMLELQTRWVALRLKRICRGFGHKTIGSSERQTQSLLVRILTNMMHISLHPSRLPSHHGMLSGISPHYHPGRPFCLE